LGGHIPLGSTSISELIAQIDAGKLRPLAVSSASDWSGSRTCPPGRNWAGRGLGALAGDFGPPEMSKQAYEYWNKKFAQMVQTKTWKETLVKNELVDEFMSGDQFAKELEKDNVQFRELLGTLGMLAK